MLIDGLVVVRYRPALPPGHRRDLAAWVADGPRGVVVVPGPDGMEAATESHSRERMLSCDELATSEQADFRDEWFGSLRR